MSGFVCGSHRCFVYERGGVYPVGELTPVERVQWKRIRDDISTAQCVVPTHSCCELLADLRVILHELHIERNGVKVWQGPITRLDYEFDQVTVVAEDLLWQAKRLVLTQGYDQSYPNIGNAMTRMDWLIRDQCYALYGNPWNVIPRPIRHQGEPRTSRAVHPYQFYVWEDFDKYAEDSGCDYTMINREIFFFDNHLAWKILPPLSENHMSQFPRITEYGNDLATRCFVTNSEGYAGQAAVAPGGYGVVDLLINNTQDAVANEVPTPEEIAAWSETAAHALVGKKPAPMSVGIPANTTLLPGAPWDVEDLIPGAWFEVSVWSLCRQMTQWQRLHEITVEESAPDGETVHFTAVDAPLVQVLP